MQCMNRILNINLPDMFKYVKLGFNNLNYDQRLQTGTKYRRKKKRKNLKRRGFQNLR